jgi:hypothetical protein
LLPVDGQLLIKRRLSPLELKLLLLKHMLNHSLALEASIFPFQTNASFAKIFAHPDPFVGNKPAGI